MISRVTKSKWLPIVAGLYESPWRRASIGVAVLLAVVLLSSCDDGTTVLPTAIPQTISATSTPGQVPPTLMPEPTRTTLPESTPSQIPTAAPTSEPTSTQTPVSDLPPPGAVRDLQAVSVTETSIMLQWKPPANSDAASVERYEVARDISLRPDEHYFVSETAFTETGLRSGTEHKYRVKAIGEGGTEGEEVSIRVSTLDSSTPEPTRTPTPEPTPIQAATPTSEPTSTQTPVSDLPPPGAVRDLQAVSVTETSIMLQWKPPANSDAASVERYEVARDISLRPDEHYFVSETAFTETGLRSGTEHKYRVKAIGEGGTEGEEVSIRVSTLDSSTPEPTRTPTPEPTPIQAATPTSEPTSTQTPVSDLPPPGAVRDLQAVSVTETSIMLQWKPPANSDAASVERYEVARDISLRPDEHYFVSETAFTETGLRSGTEHKYRVKAIGEGGTEGEEVSIRVSTLDSSTPEPTRTPTPEPTPIQAATPTHTPEPISTPTPVPQATPTSTRTPSTPAILSATATSSATPVPSPTRAVKATPTPSTTPPQVTPTPTSGPPPSATPTPQAIPDVRIRCIFFDGVVSRQEPDEYVEIFNAGKAPQDLEGWSLMDISDGLPTFVFPQRTLAPGSTVRLYTNEVHEEWGGFSFGRGSAVWSNSDPDTAGLYDAQGRLVSTKSYPPGCE